MRLAGVVCLNVSSVEGSGTSGRFFSFFVIHLQIKGVSRTLWCEDGVKLVPLEWKMIWLGDCPPAHQHCCGNAGVSGRQDRWIWIPVFSWYRPLPDLIHLFTCFRWCPSSPWPLAHERRESRQDEQGSEGGRNNFPGDSFSVTARFYFRVRGIRRMETATGALPNLHLAIPSYHIAGVQRPNYYMGRHLKGHI